MNYMKELNAFREYLLRFHLPTSAVVLWYTLMQINNSTGWKKEFEASNSIVNQLCGLSKQSVANARAVLIEKGLITYIPGKKGVAPIYGMLPVMDQLPYTNADQYKASNMDESQETGPHFDQSEGPYKDPKWNKPKEILKQKDKERRGSTHGKNAFTVYEENLGMLSPIARESLQEWIDDMGEEMVIAAMTLGVKNGAHSFRYIEKILQEWSRAKIETMEQLQAYQKQRELRKARGSSRQAKADQKQAVFDKLRKGAGHDKG